MKKFDQLTGVAAPLNILNIDTDMIIPKQFLKTIKRSGLGANLFDEMRFTQDGEEIADFVLNREPYRGVISTSFADIFYNNCFKNGILPITVSADDRDALMADAADVENPELSIDLETQTIRRPNGVEVSFDIDPFRKQCLLEGLDDIGLTLEKGGSIDSFEATRAEEKPWL
jgi:3-isopropylmalate/(R)-2-methylmalate dehydratase small subunit